MTDASNRRSFLKATGFTMTGLLAGCGRAPVQKAIPYLVQPEEITPGKSYYYASTCNACPARCGVLVKNRDGRPIKLEGNPDHPLSQGGLCAVGQASLLGLYDSRRYRQPFAAGRPCEWTAVDEQVMAKLAEARANGAAVRYLSDTISSPALREAVREFLATFRDGRHIVYDPLSHSAILDAHERTHGARVLPHYRFDRADVIVSFDADFLGTWIAPVEFTRAWAAKRKPPAMSYHVQFEARMSLTGTKADRRIRVSPDEMAAAMSKLNDALAARVSGADDRFLSSAILAGHEKRWPAPPAEGREQAADTVLDRIAARLWAARGRSLVICGSGDVAAQALGNSMNHLLGNYGQTVDIESPSRQYEGSDEALAELIGEMEGGKVAVLMVHGVNPVYDRPGFEHALRRVPAVVSLATHPDETSGAAHFVSPDHHWLESWGDAEPVRGLVSITQPAIEPLGKTRAAIESLAIWSGRPAAAYDAVRRRWAAFESANFEAFWRKSLEAGFAAVASENAAVRPFKASSATAARRRSGPAAGALALILYPKPGLLDGAHAHNPWLQELPDPVTKITWDNYACLAPATAARLGIESGDVVRLEANGKALELPALVQPGQHRGVVAVAVGYGRQGTERFANGGPQWLFAKKTTGENGLVGVNANVLADEPSVRIAKTGRKHVLASAQAQPTIAVPKHLAPPDGDRRPIIRELSLDAFARGLERHEKHASLWPPGDHPYRGHRWGMAIDLHACTGCSACVVACQVENNVPVVGKDEVARKRAMHWLRIDRYYDEHGDDAAVAHQPMLCQQCGNASCETVCPVLATVHSEEGLNQQVYNRCVGTRYCENNCPYKARRFNWFEYARDDKLANLVLNPDVTVRGRGVMEKCTFCVQRIQEQKIAAKAGGRTLADGDIQTACQQSCPAQAIVFGDLNDPESRVAQLARDKRAYRVLEETNVEPSISYLAVVRQSSEETHG